LGARAREVTGSIKFDLTIDPQLLQRAAELRAMAGAGTPGVDRRQYPRGRRRGGVGGPSSVAGEPSRCLLILVPRHPERFNAVFELSDSRALPRCAAPRRAGHRATSVLLGDTMGELLFLYALADSAFVGGSLVPNGGHNLLEPAALAKPVLSGPHLFNFLEIAAQLRSAGALQEVDDAEGWHWRCGVCSSCPGCSGWRRRAEGDAANQGALQRLLDGLGRLIERA
jgi:3-deoxy-D-manno-octulosonic-acid transferase